MILAFVCLVGQDRMGQGDSRFIGPVRFVEIRLLLMFMLICCERKTLFVR
jgi:hypothetical protein